MKLSRDETQANVVALLKRRKNAHTEEAEEQAFEADIPIERLTL